MARLLRLVPRNMAKQLMAKQLQVGLLLAAVRRRQRQAVESRVAEMRLSSQKFWVLEALVQQNGCTLAELLYGLAMDQPTASRVLAELRSRGLIEVTMDSDDRRRRIIRLTAQGSLAARQCSAVGKQIRKTLTANFSKKELANLCDYLERILHNFDDLDDVAPPRLMRPHDKLGATSPAKSSAPSAAFNVSNRSTYWRSLQSL